MAGKTVKDMTTNFKKLNKFRGHDFRRWQKKMHFLLTTLKMVYALTTPMPELLEDATVKTIRIRVKWENDDYICRGHILNDDSSSKKFLVDAIAWWIDSGATTHVDAIAWWIDSGATTHVCKDRCWFKTFEPVEDGYALYMGDDHFAPVHGKGSMALEFSYGKTITLFNVLLSRFTSNHSRQYWKAITRVFKYLRGTNDYGLSYVGYPSVLEGYSDASWINHVEDSSLYEWMCVPAWGRCHFMGFQEANMHH
nr:zinc finger, CCHC-type [Tanacetum cinerariifolium]